MFSQIILPSFSMTSHEPHWNVMNLQSWKMKLKNSMTILTRTLATKILIFHSTGPVAWGNGVHTTDHMHIKIIDLCFTCTLSFRRLFGGVNICDPPTSPQRWPPQALLELSLHLTFGVTYFPWVNNTRGDWERELRWEQVTNLPLGTPQSCTTTYKIS